MEVLVWQTEGCLVGFYLRSGSSFRICSSFSMSCHVTSSSFCSLFPLLHTSRRLHPYSMRRRASISLMPSSSTRTLSTSRKPQASKAGGSLTPSISQAHSSGLGIDLAEVIPSQPEVSTQVDVESLGSSPKYIHNTLISLYIMLYILYSLKTFPTNPSIHSSIHPSIHRW